MRGGVVDGRAGLYVRVRQHGFGDRIPVDALRRVCDLTEVTVPPAPLRAVETSCAVSSATVVCVAPSGIGVPSAEVRVKVNAPSAGTTPSSVLVA